MYLEARRVVREERYAFWMRWQLAWGSVRGALWNDVLEVEGQLRRTGELVVHALDCENVPGSPSRWSRVVLCLLDALEARLGVASGWVWGRFFGARGSATRSK